MGIRNYYIDLAEGKRKGFLSFVFKVFFFIPTCLYWLVISLRNFFYHKNFILKEEAFKIPVISAGNITWGGTGKTSLVIALSKLFSLSKVAVFTRGYGSDEKDMLEELLSKEQAKIISGKDRVRLLREAESLYDLAILDDGFQYRRIKRDLDILLINGNNPFGSGTLIPSGSLREPKACIKRADVAVIMHADNENLKNYLKTLSPKIDIFNAYYQVEGLADLKGNTYSKEELADKKIASFCAIGYPEGFIKSLGSLSLRPLIRFIYPDHHILLEEEFREIERKCELSGVKDLIITAKDKTRFKFFTQLSIWILKVALKIEPQEDFLSLVQRRAGLKIESKTLKKQGL
ncbi:MAG: tetraacyldisaccharide 4'-kinase [Candidatus Omnitrophica bacterium]|nr:tetraacyldisaccharide 4'-kinase [Candidatus Omnitrophota bacterium]